MARRRAPGRIGQLRQPLRPCTQPIEIVLVVLAQGGLLDPVEGLPMAIRPLGERGQTGGLALGPARLAQLLDQLEETEHDLL